MLPMVTCQHNHSKSQKMERVWTAKQMPLKWTRVGPKREPVRPGPTRFCVRTPCNSSISCQPTTTLNSPAYHLLLLRLRTRSGLRWFDPSPERRAWTSFRTQSGRPSPFGAAPPPPPLPLEASLRFSETRRDDLSRRSRSSRRNRRTRPPIRFSELRTLVCFPCFLSSITVSIICFVVDSPFSTFALALGFMPPLRWAAVRVFGVWMEKVDGKRGHSSNCDLSFLKAMRWSDRVLLVWFPFCLLIYLDGGSIIMASFIQAFGYVSISPTCSRIEIGGFDSLVFTKDSWG